MSKLNLVEQEDVGQDITWEFTIKVKTDSSTGQPSMEDMVRILHAMTVQLEDLSDSAGYVYKVMRSEVDSDE